MRRTILSFAILIALSQTASAGVLLFGHVSCAVVRFYVAKYSEAAAERWARSQGASNVEIETARRCLHSTVMQTASSAAKPEVHAPVTAEERAKHERVERDSDQDAPNGAPVQGQRADPEQDKPGNEPAPHDVIHAKYTEDRSASNTDREIKDLSPSAKTTTALHHYTRATYHTDRVRGTSHGSWLKRMWAYLTKRRQFSVAFLNFNGGRR
jgi:hypothetical protein